MLADQLHRDIINAKTFPAIQAAIDYAARIGYDANQQLVRAQLPPRLERYWSRLVIGPEGSGGLPTQTKFELAIFCTEEKLKNRASDRLICMIKRDSTFGSNGSNEFITIHYHRYEQLAGRTV